MKEALRLLPALMVLGGMPAIPSEVEAGPPLSKPARVDQEIERASAEVASALGGHLKRRSTDCPRVLYSTETMPLDGATVSGVTDPDFHIGWSPEIQCGASGSSCVEVVYSIDGGMLVGLIAVTGSCVPAHSPDAFPTADGVWWLSSPDLRALAPPPEFSKEIEVTKDGFPIVNPLNIDYFLEQNKGKKVVVVFSIASCVPCNEVKEAFRSWGRKDAVLAVVDCDNTLYSSDGRDSEVGKAFARKFGLKAMPTYVPVVVLLQGDNITLISGGKERVRYLKDALDR